MADDANTGFNLPPGATGFSRPQEGPLPDTDLRAFRAALHRAAREAGGRVGELEERSHPGTFHIATVVGRTGEHVVLCHAHLPWVAFVPERRNWYADDFLEPPSWAGAFAHGGFTVLGREQLAMPLSGVDTSALTRAEWHGIRLYGVTALGGVLFNAWA